MKVFIEEKETGRFLMEFDEWTSDLRQAKDFKQSDLAIHHCVKRGVQAVSVLLVFGMDRRMDVRLEPFAVHPARESMKADASQERFVTRRGR